MEGRKVEGCRSHVERTKCSFVVGLHTRRTLLIARFVMQMPCRPSQPPSAILSSPLSLLSSTGYFTFSLSLSVLSLDSRVSRTFKRLPSPFLFPFALARDFVAFNPEKVPPLFDPYLGARESFKPPSGPTFRYLMETWKLAFHRWNNKF